VVTWGGFESNPNLLFIFSFYLCFLNLIIKSGTNPNLTCVKKFIYIYIYIIYFYLKFIFQFSSICDFQQAISSTYGLGF